MWAIFILPLALFGAVGALFGVVNGSTLVVVTLATDQWQRRRGHKPGEGALTDREGGHVFGLKVSRESTDLGQFLAGMVEAFPDLFEEFRDKSFDLTVSEGVFLRSMVTAAQGQLGEYLGIVEQVNEDPDNDDLVMILRYRQEQLRASLVPISKYLHDVPATRVKEAVA